jgi:hypothetical protein
MKKQSTQLIALVSLVVIWAVLWRLFIRVPTTTPAPAKPVAAKTAPPDSLLRMRFHRVRSEMESLYHYRTKPTGFDARWNPFRIPAGVELSGESAAATAPTGSKLAVSDLPPSGPMTPDYAQSLLKGAVANMKIGGVVILNGAIQLTVDGKLHKEGDVFSTKVLNSKGQGRTLIIGIRRLTTESVTLVLEDPQANGASVKVRLN